jgi:amino acid adenylation domain-containing protein
VTAANPPARGSDGHGDGAPAAPARFPLSAQQARIWDLGPDHPGLVAQAAVTIDGSLDEQRLEAAAQRVFRRYEILRTTFAADPGEEPVQLVGDDGAPSWQRVDVPVADGDQQARLLRDQRSVPFDRSRGPVLRMALARLGGAAQTLILTLPALHADDRSLAVLVDELAAEYGGAASTGGQAPPPLQHGDFTLWQHEVSDPGAPDQAGREFWRRHVGPGSFDPGIALLEPSLSARFDPDCMDRTLDTDTVASIKALAVELGSSAESFLALCWHVVLARLAGGSNVAVGMRFDGRPYPELTSAVGPLSRYLPLRWAVDPDEPMAAALGRMDALLAEARDWQECFAWDAVPDGAPPAIPACFEFLEDPPPRIAGSCTFAIADRYAGPDRFRVRLTCVARGPELRLMLYYDPVALKHGDAASVLAQVAELARSAAAEPGAPLGTLRSIDPTEERRIVVALNDAPRAAVPTRCVHELIADVARRAPDDVALALGAERMTYAELDASANRVARALVRLGVGRESRVGICLKRSPDLVVALLAVLKAGAAYVPVDSTYPPARVEFMLRDSGAHVVLTRAALRDRLPDGAARVVSLDAERAAIASEPSDAPAVRVDAADLAYVIYTSGSTGAPKGAMVTHAAFANYVVWCVSAYSIAAGSGAPVHSPIGFDLTVTSLWGTLVAGRTVVLVPEEEGLDGLAAVLRSRPDFSVVKLTPSQLDVLSEIVPAEAAAGCTRAFVVGGEQLATESIAFWREHAPATRIFNEYGPTEATVGCCVHEVADRALPPGRVPIGRPGAGSALYVLDAHLHPVPAGVPGELYIGGPGVARGYLGRPDLTAERFVPDAFSGAPGARLYRTGDRARLLEDGNLEFVDRVDRQVKIRGFRVEPEELERALVQHGAVERSVVVVGHGPGGPRLVAYCARRPAAEVSREELNVWLTERLPPFLLPADVIVLDSLPLTANGKVDVAALPPAAPARQPYITPRTAVERVLAGIWADVLETDRVGVHDSFFDLGGQSMSAARMVFLIRDALQIDLPLRTVFEAPTIAALAEAIGADTADGNRAATAARVVIELGEMTEDEVRMALAPGEHGLP